MRFLRCDGTRVVEAHSDVFALYDPAEDLPPERRHPWATIVTSDNPYDATSHPDRTWPTVQGLLTEAHAFAVRKYDNAARRAQA